MTLLQYGANAWLKETPEQAEWHYFPTGFKQGYQGLNTIDLLQQVTGITATEDAGAPVYQVTFDFVSEPLLALILNDVGMGATLLETADTVTTTGIIWLDRTTRQPLREQVTVFIDDPLLPINLETSLVYDFTTPVTIPMPTGEAVLVLADQFLTAVRDNQLDSAYAFFSSQARQTVPENAFTNFVAANQDLFTGYQSISLTGFAANPPTTANRDGDFRQITGTAVYSTQPPIQYRLIFENEGDQWQLFRFDLIE